MAGRLELLAAAERVDGDLYLEPFDVARVLLELPRFDRFELIAGHRRPPREVGGQQVLRVRDEPIAIPEPDRVPEPGMRAEHVLVLLADVNAADRRSEVVDQVRLVWQVDELVRVRLEQPARIPDRLAVGQAIVLDLAELLLLTPALSIRRLIGRGQHAGTHLPCKP